MYATLKDIAKKYSVSMSYIKKHELIEGKHFIYIGKMKRYHIDNMHELLVSTPQHKSKNSHILDLLLLEN